MFDMNNPNIYKALVPAVFGTSAAAQMQKGGEVKKDDSYGVTDFTKDAYEAWFNPKNYGVKEYSEKTFDKSYTKARSEGEKEFLYENRRYNTNYNGTPAEQLKETGITDTQITGTNIIKDRLHKNMNDFEYDNPIEGIVNTVLLDKKRNPNKPDIKDKEEYVNTHSDMFNVYLGKPQNHNTLGISDYKPTKSSDKNTQYYKIEGSPNKEELYKTILKKGIKLKNGETTTIEDIGTGMGTFTVSRGKDEKGNYISYYDKWDVNPFKGEYSFNRLRLLDNEKYGDISMGIGKPYEIYDRIYYEKDYISQEEYDSKISDLQVKEEKIKNSWYKDNGDIDEKIYKETYSEYERVIEKRYDIIKKSKVL